MRKYNGEDRPEPGSQLSTFSCVPRAKWLHFSETQFSHLQDNDGT
jgi:hypothetical protein